jgi:hypothetical protein
MVQRYVPDVFIEPGNTSCSIAGVQSKPQLSFADRQFPRAVEPSNQFCLTQIRTRTQPFRAVLGLVLDASRRFIK